MNRQQERIEQLIELRDQMRRQIRLLHEVMDAKEKELQEMERENDAMRDRIARLTHAAVAWHKKCAACEKRIRDGLAQ